MELWVLREEPGLVYTGAKYMNKNTPLKFLSNIVYLTRVGISVGFHSGQSCSIKHKLKKYLQRLTEFRISLKTSQVSSVNYLSLPLYACISLPNK